MNKVCPVINWQAYLIASLSRLWLNIEAHLRGILPTIYVFGVTAIVVVIVVVAVADVIGETAYELNLQFIVHSGLNVLCFVVVVSHLMQFAEQFMKL